MKNEPNSPNPTYVAANIFRVKGNLFAIYQGYLFVYLSTSTSCGLTNAKMIQLNITDPRPKPEQHIPAQRPFRSGRCKQVFFTGGQQPIPILKPQNTPQNTIKPIKLVINETVNTETPTPIIAHAQRILLEILYKNVEEIPTPTLIIIIVRVNKIESDVLDVGFPAQYRQDDIQGIKAPNVQIDPNTISVTNAEIKAIIAYLGIADILISRSSEYYNNCKEFPNQQIFALIYITCVDYIFKLKMFRKLRTEQNKYSNQKQNNSYSQRAMNISKIKNASYSRMHMIKKAVPSQILDYHKIFNDSYIYQGQWTGSYKNGEGIALMKNGCILIGHWHKDQLDGRSLIITPFGGLISAYFINGKLNGWVLAQYKDKLIIANLYFQDKVDGPRIVFEASQQLWIASDFTFKGELIKITHVQKGKKNKLPIFLENDQLYYLFQEMIVERNFTYDFDKIKTIEINSESRYIGYVNKQNLPEGLGTTYSQYECFIGNFSNGFLQGFGRMIFNNGDIYHGGLAKGEFFGHAIYYNFSENKTMVINSKLDEQNEVLQQQNGYYLVDFEYYIGQKMNKSDKINFSQSVQKFLKLLQKYYNQYHLQSRDKEMINYSNISEEQSGEERFKDIDQLQQSKNLRVTNNIKWISGNQKQGISQQADSYQQNFSLKDQTYSHRNQQFFSITIKENQQDITQRQKYRMQNPKNIETKKNLFLSTKMNQSKSLDINELSFKGSSKKQNKDQGPVKSRKQAQKQTEQIYLQFQQTPRSDIYQKIQPLSSRKSSQISNMDEKLTKLMKNSKLSTRRRIFQ